MIIREGEPQDIGELASMLDELFRIEDDFVPDRKNQEKGLEMVISGNGRSVILVAEMDGIIAGMVNLQMVVSTASGGYSVLLEDMFVKSGFRGKGIGKSLVDRAVSWGVEQGAVRIQLAADRRNGAADTFYRNNGFSGSNMECYYKPI